MSDKVIKFPLEKTQKFEFDGPPLKFEVQIGFTVDQPGRHVVAVVLEEAFLNQPLNPRAILARQASKALTSVADDLQMDLFREILAAQDQNE